MKATAPKKTWLYLIRGAAAVIEARDSPLPAMKCVRLEARKVGSASGPGRVTALGLSYSMAARVECEVNVKATGDVMADAKSLLDRIGAMPDGDVELSCGDDRVLTIKSGKRKVTLATLNVSDAPMMPAPARDPVTIDPAPLVKMIGAAIHCVMVDSSQPGFKTSLCLEFDGETTRAVGLDGHRVAVATGPAIGTAPFKHMIPRKSALEISKALDGADSATFGVTDRWLTVAAGERSISALLTDSEMPPWRQIWPTEFVATIDAGSRDELVAAIAAIGSVDSGVRLTVGKSGLTIASRGVDGQADDELDVDVTGKAAVGFEAGYLVDALKSADGPGVTVKLGGANDPALVVGGSSEVVIMPRNLSW